MATRNFLPNIFRGERTGQHPVREMMRMQRRMEQMFDDLYNDALPSLGQPVRGMLDFENVFSPPCDINETDTQYLVNFDIPGVKKDEIKVEARDNQLIVSGERKKEHKEDVKGHISQERYYGSFMRSFTLPSNVDANKVEAHFDNGELQIIIPKAAAAQGNQIPIKEGKRLTQKKEAKDEKAA
jgi:HSP20 family protein